MADTRRVAFSLEAFVVETAVLSGNPRVHDSPQEHDYEYE